MQPPPSTPSQPSPTVSRRRGPSREEETMRRFAAGTLNVGLSMTMQRKGVMISFAPESVLRESLNRFCNNRGIDRVNRCYNVQLTLHPEALPIAERLTRIAAYQKHPFTHATVTITPAQQDPNDSGRRRTKAWPVHAALQGAPQVKLNNLAGDKKGEVNLLQFVQETCDYLANVQQNGQGSSAGNRTLTDDLLKVPSVTTKQIAQLASTPAATRHPLMPTNGNIAAPPRTGGKYASLRPHVPPYPLRARSETPIAEQRARLSELENIIEQGLIAAQILFGGKDQCAQLHQDDVNVYSPPLPCLPTKEMFLNVERARLRLKSDFTISSKELIHALQSYRKRARTYWRNKQGLSTDDGIDGNLCDQFGNRVVYLTQAEQLGWTKLHREPVEGLAIWNDYLVVPMTATIKKSSTSGGGGGSPLTSSSSWASAIPSSGDGAVSSPLQAPPA